MRTVRPVPADFTIIIRYPKPGGDVVHGRGITIYRPEGDKETLITTCGALSTHADAHGILWAEAELWADEEGNPIFDGQPVMNNTQIITKIFNCHVKEIRSESSFTAGYRDAYEYITGRTAPPRLPLSRAKAKALIKK